MNSKEIRQTLLISMLVLSLLPTAYSASHCRDYAVEGVNTICKGNSVFTSNNLQIKVAEINSDAENVRLEIYRRTPYSFLQDVSVKPSEGVSFLTNLDLNVQLNRIRNDGTAEIALGVYRPINLVSFAAEKRAEISRATAYVTKGKVKARRSAVSSRP